MRLTTSVNIWSWLLYSDERRRRKVLSLVDLPGKLKNTFCASVESSKSEKITTHGLVSLGELLWEIPPNLTTLRQVLKRADLDNDGDDYDSDQACDLTDADDDNDGLDDGPDDCEQGLNPNVFVSNPVSDHDAELQVQLN